MGYPVAYSLAGTALIFAGIGTVTGLFDSSYLLALPSFVGIIINQTLLAVPLFVFMGVMLERSKIAEDLLGAMETLFGRVRGGLAISVIIVGVLWQPVLGLLALSGHNGVAFSTHYVERGYDPAIATGTICATGTLGQIIRHLLRWFCWVMLCRAYQKHS